jgi:hypothetical protein
MASFKQHPQAAIVLTIIAALGLCTPAWAVDFAGGTGDPNDPYQIATAEQLVALGSDPALLAKYFVLVDDIDLDPNLPGGQVFGRALIAADASDANFNGAFDGQGFKVLNLTIAAPEGAGGPLALFGRIGSRGRICNLGVENAAVRAGSDSKNVAILAGINAGEVRACYTTGSVGGGSRIGGLCGENSGLIRDCYSTASVSGDAQVGGLVGRSNPSRFFPVLKGVGADGGVVGCYSSGAVWACETAGGLIGEWSGDTQHSGAQASFWDFEASGLKVSAGGIGLTTTQMRKAAVFAAEGWDKDPNWVMEDGRDYPRLAWEETGGRPIAGTLSDYFTGAGTAQDPYRIDTPEQFALIGLLPNLWDKHFVLEADLDLAHFSLQPIAGGPSRSVSYTGFFHGNGHVLRNVSVRARYPLVAGLFGDIGSQGCVSNLGLETVVVTAMPHTFAVGALAGTNEGIITGCYATGMVQAELGQFRGGLVGVNSGRVASSYAAADIAPWGGKLVGRQDSSGLVLECYASGETQVSTSYSALVGTDSGGIVANCYFLKESDKFAIYPGRVPLDDAQMRQRENFVGWDFVGSSSDGPLDRWYMPEANYPILNWQADLQGPRPIPDVSHLPLEWARAEIELAGFVMGEVTYDYHSTIPKEDAIVTSPLGLAAPGSIIDVVVSRGQYPYFADYEGYSYSPNLIQIATPGQLEYFAGSFSGNTNFILTRNIDMAGWEVLPARSRSPSYSGPAFAGTFLGNGHKVSNLKIFRGSGLFDQIASEGMVHGLTLENVVVAGSTSESLGTLAAINHGAVLDCSVQGAIVGGDSVAHLGGLIGKNEGIVSECSAATAVRGQYVTSSARETMTVLPATGGLVGLNSSGTIANSCAAGEVSAGGWVGGLVGGNYAPISRCYAATHVAGQGAENAGGLVGHNPTIPAPPYRGRAFTASPPTDTPAPVTDCYFLSLASGGGPDNGVGTALAAEEMSRQASFAGWDFENIWMICEGRDYPRLRWEGVECGAQQ